MQESPHIKALSLTLALSVIIGGWLLFEYANQGPLPPNTRGSEGIRKTGAPSRQEPVHVEDKKQTETAPLSNIDQVKPHLTYKCEKSGRIIFADQPCPQGSKTRSITAVERSSPQANDHTLAKLKQEAATLAAERQAREEKYAANRSAMDAYAIEAEAKRDRCMRIDKQIESIDMQSRQPHSASWGDYLTQERRKLMDNRFSQGC